MPRYNLILSTKLWWLVKVLPHSWLATEPRYWTLIGWGCSDRMSIVDTLSGCPPVLLQTSSICLPLSLRLSIDDVLARVLIYLLYWPLIGRGRSRDLSPGPWLVDPLWPHNLSGPGLRSSGSSSESSAVITSCKEKITSMPLPCNSHISTFYQNTLSFPKFNLYCKRHLGTLCCANVRMIMAGLNYFWEKLHKSSFLQ